jgi:hypothetical protein
MTHIKRYISPDMEVVEIEVERGFDSSGVEIPDFENENEL